MSEHNNIIRGHAAVIRIENLDTDQIMPKQFLHGIDKSGLAKGVLYDLRHDENGQIRPDFVLNRPENARTGILVTGSNFGCGSSREHAVWGLMQYGIRAVIAPSFGEIFYSNAMGNRLMLVMLPPDQIERLMTACEGSHAADVEIDVANRRVRGGGLDVEFALSVRHRQMYLDNLDVIGLTQQHQQKIDAFAHTHWQRHPWMHDVATKTQQRLLLAV
jgi:3-isopropylmalate/(R)-2-methylmalate dehydratase small subunit